MSTMDNSEAPDVAARPADAPEGDDSKVEAGPTPSSLGWAAPTPFDYEGFADKNHSDWFGVAARYEWHKDWSDEFGEIGPRNEELEEQLFQSNYIQRAGARLNELNNPAVVLCESETPISGVKEWADAGLHPVILENVNRCLYDRPTTIQSFTIPAVMSDKDLIGIAQTGSGKTGAFLIPILSKLMGKAKKLCAPRPSPLDLAPGESVRGEPLVLVVCPTRELATQIFDEARRLCYRSMLRPCVVYGGAPSRLQREELKKGCDILIGTPGRIIDFMCQPHVLTLRRVRFTIIDEADELLQSDWEEDFKMIMSGGDMTEDDDHRYLMFSATFNKECRKLAREYLRNDYIRIRVGRPGSSHLNVVQRVHYAEESMKRQALYDLLMSMHPIRTLVFVNSKTEVDNVDDFLYNHGLPSTSIHGGRTQREREDAIRSFRSARCPIMVATGVSARGLDIVNVMHVINFDLPSAQHGGITEYVHRIGRTARIGNEGMATSFYNNERDEAIAADLVKILRECDQDIPDFLQDYVPDEVTFDDDTDKEDDDEDEDEDDSDKFVVEPTDEDPFTVGTATDTFKSDNFADEATQAW